MAAAVFLGLGHFKHIHDSLGHDAGVMADIRISRTHSLGLDEARKVAAAWTEQVETRFGMAEPAWWATIGP